MMERARAKEQITQLVNAFSAERAILRPFIREASPESYFLSDWQHSLIFPYDEDFHMTKTSICIRKPHSRRSIPAHCDT